MAYEAELHADQLPWTPDGKTYEATENANIEQELPLNIAWATDTLKVIQTFYTWKPNLFDLASELYTGLQVQR